MRSRRRRLRCCLRSCCSWCDCRTACTRACMCNAYLQLRQLVSAELPPSAPVTDEGASAVAALPAAGAVSFKPAVPALKEVCGARC